MFKKGDLVKHASNINWRDQGARGVVTNSIKDAKHECVFVTWINARKHNSPNTHLGTSLDLVADCINDVQ